MSASTVAITANPVVTNGPSLALDTNSNPNVRRRTVAIAEKRSNIEMVSEGGISGSKDLSHSLRGETVVQKPKELSHVRKELVNSTVSPRRRKAVTKPEKPRWKTVLSVLTKNLLLLIVLFGLGHMIWKSTWKPEDSIGAPIGDFEGRISDIEALVKSTAKMMQVQVDIVDKKIGNEVGSLRKELTKKVEEKDILIQDQLKKLGDRTDNLDKSLAELRDKGYLSKEEFENFLNELKSKGVGEGDKDLSLDEIRAVAREIVEKEIEKHAADGLGRVDYAVASSGAKVIRHSEPFYFDKGSSWLPSVSARSRNGVHFLAQKMLEPSFGEPGHCFPLKGSNGFVEIRLRAAIVPEAVTLEHVAKNVAYDRSSAPKDCRVSGWFQGPDDDPSAQSDEKFMLVEFTYDLDKSNAQTFNIKADDVGIINMVRLDFASNQGSPSHTCIYRLRVHGYEPECVPTLALQS
ncbi:SUN domain-containing protein 1 [Magnolia sinica]|uniref:SUN domain-containing protein 1 n=1 Tax=Magnolia sinica TaxID=86752 RepID=UPI002658B712|nr:SUN domain-containing protein 1 [Magnolia sinica]XP_058078434.1 SUN domain-containing protein 1 [Magnolia sinica]